MGISYQEFESQALYLARHPIERDRMGKKAYETITTLWNAEHAADELLRFCRGILQDGNAIPAQEGPLSRAEVIPPPKAVRTMQEDNHLH